jgi:hypothetical protein
MRAPTPSSRPSWCLWVPKRHPYSLTWSFRVFDLGDEAGARYSASSTLPSFASQLVRLSRGDARGPDHRHRHAPSRGRRLAPAGCESGPATMAAVPTRARHQPRPIFAPHPTRIGIPRCVRAEIAFSDSGATRKRPSRSRRNRAFFISCSPRGQAPRGVATQRFFRDRLSAADASKLQAVAFCI